MNDLLSPVVNALQSKFNAQVSEFRDEVTLTLHPGPGGACCYYPARPVRI